MIFCFVGKVVFSDVTSHVVRPSFAFRVWMGFYFVVSFMKVAGAVLLRVHALVIEANKGTIQSEHHGGKETTSANDK